MLVAEVGTAAAVHRQTTNQ